jgi:dCMP deaminase
MGRQDELDRIISDGGGLVSSVMSFEEMFMRQVYLVAARSKDPRTKIGAILVRDNNVISTGYNNFPAGVLDLKNRYENREVKYDFVVHAEANSILAAAKRGTATEGATLFSQGIPCRECAKSVIQAGISHVICHKQWPNLTYSEAWVKSIDITKTMFREAGVVVEWFDKGLGVEGFLDGKTIII